MAYMDYTQKQSAPSLRKADLALAILFCAALGIGCLSLIVRMGTKTVAVKRIFYSEKLAKMIFFDNELLQFECEWQFSNPKIDEKKMYPLSEEIKEFYKSEIQPEKTERRYTLQNPKIVGIVNQLEFWFDRYFLLYDFFAVNSGKIQDFLGVRHFNQIKLPNGNFSPPSKKLDVSKSAERLLKFQEFLSRRAIPFLYVQAPHKIPPEVSLNEPNDFSNKNIDDFLSLIEGKVNYVDLRVEMKKSGMNHCDAFYISDGHWKVETGFWAAKVVAEKLNEYFQLEIDAEILNPENFEFEVLAESFLARYGKGVALVLSEMEDSFLIRPKKDFSLEAEFYSDEILKRKSSGGFEIMFFPERIRTLRPVFRNILLNAVMSGNDNAFIKNNSAENDFRVLFLGDSFSNSVKLYFSLCVKDSDILDLRSFNGSLSAFIDAHERYDACVMLVNPSSLDPDYSGGQLFDFR